MKLSQLFSLAAKPFLFLLEYIFKFTVEVVTVNVLGAPCASATATLPSSSASATSTRAGLNTAKLTSGPTARLSPTFEEMMQTVDPDLLIVTTGDLISELYVTESSGGEPAGIGKTLPLLERADVHHSSYIRVRGTNTDQLEQEIDPAGEDPWTDLWFYSNPALYEPCKYREHNFNLN